MSNCVTFNITAAQGSIAGRSVNVEFTLPPGTSLNSTVPTGVTLNHTYISTGDDNIILCLDIVDQAAFDSALDKRVKGEVINVDSNLFNNIMFKDLNVVCVNNDSDNQFDCSNLENCSIGDLGDVIITCEIVDGEEICTLSFTNIDTIEIDNIVVNNSITYQGDTIEGYIDNRIEQYINENITDIINNYFQNDFDCALIEDCTDGCPLGEVGSACYDGDPCTTGSTVQPGCSCGGGIPSPPDNSCAALTCVGQTCTDSCGNTINGTLDPTPVAVTGTLYTAGGGDLIITTGDGLLDYDNQIFTLPYPDFAGAFPNPGLFSNIGGDVDDPDYHVNNGTFTFTGPFIVITDNGTDWEIGIDNTIPGDYSIVWTSNVVNPDCTVDTATWSWTVVPDSCQITIDSLDIVNECDGGSNGSLTVNATGVGLTGSLEYAINDSFPLVYQSSNIFTGLSEGLYSVRVRDSGKTTCIATQQFNIIDEVCAAMCSVTIDSVATSDPSCTGTTLNTDGTIIINATLTNGTGSLEYSIDNGVSFQSSNMFNTLSGGTYNIIVRDDADTSCSDSDSTTLVNPDCSDPCTLGLNSVQILLDRIHPSCSTPGSPNSDGQITVTTTGSTPSGMIEYSVGSGFQSSNVFTGLSAGTYTVTARDPMNTSCSVGVVGIELDDRNCPDALIIAGDDDFDADPDNNFGPGTPGVAYTGVDVISLDDFSNLGTCTGPYSVTITGNSNASGSTLSGTSITVLPDAGLSDGDAWFVDYEICCDAPNGSVCDTGRLSGTVRVVVITDPCDVACTPSLSFLAVDQTLGTRLEVFNTSLAPAPLVTDITMVPTTTLTYNSSSGVGLTGLVVHTYDSPSNILGLPPGPNSWSVNWDGLTTVHNLGNSPFDFATTYLEHKFASFSLANDCAANSGYTISYPVAVQQTGGTGTEFVGDTISVDWGDGSPVDNYTIGALGDVTISHTFTTTGTFTITISHAASSLLVTEQLRITC